MDMNVKNCTKIKLKIVDIMTSKKSSARWYFATFPVVPWLQVGFFVNV